MPSSPPSRGAPSPDNIDLGAVVRAVARKLPWVMIAAALVGTATSAVLSTMAPKYLSQAQLEVRGGATDNGGRPDKEAVGTHVRALMSTGMALAMSKALQLTARPEFNSALPPVDLFGRTLRSLGVGNPKSGETDEDRLMQAYFQNVRAYQVRDTRSVIVDCTTPDAKFSADCANRLAELYRDSLSGRTATDNSDLRAKLKPQVDRLAQETAAAEAAAAEFRARANLFLGMNPSGQLKDQQLGELSAELTRVSAARSDAEARATAARDMAARGIAAANPDVQKSALIPRMEEQRVGLERQIAELTATLLPGHPRMKQLRSEFVNLQAQIRAEVLKVVESLGNDARIAAAREDGIRRRIDDMKRTLVTAAPDNARLTQLENDAKSKRAELDRLQAQYEKAASTASAGAVEIEIVSRAYPSNEKVFPKITFMAAMAAFGALILGLALTLTRELVRGARPAPVIRRTASPQFEASAATAPFKIVQQAAPAPALQMSPQVAAQDLTELADGARGYRILMAGSAPVTDGAPEALGLASALAAGGHSTVLIAWAGAGPTLARTAGLEPTVGMSQLLQGAASFDDVIQTVPGTALNVIVAGDALATAVDGDSAAMVLDALDDVYDFIVVTAAMPIATQLFTALQGRFDAGVLVSATLPVSSRTGTAAFLGYNVPDFPILHVAASDAATATPKPQARAVRSAGAAFA